MPQKYVVKGTLRGNNLLFNKIKKKYSNINLSLQMNDGTKFKLKRINGCCLTVVQFQKLIFGEFVRKVEFSLSM